MIEYIALFYTNSGAIKFAKLLKDAAHVGELIPLPRKLTSSCGVGVKFSFTEDISALISEEVERIYAVRGQQYELIYCMEE